MNESTAKGPGEPRNYTEPDAELDALAKQVIGAAIEVHRNLGPGYLKSVYEKALAIEFQLRGIPFSRQHQIEIDYKGEDVGEGRLDFLVGGRLVVELKTVERVDDIHRAQTQSYMKRMGEILGLLLNFNVAKMVDGTERIINSKFKK